MPTTVTLNLPEEIATRLMQLPAQERDHLAETALATALNEDDYERTLEAEDPFFPPGTTLMDLSGFGAGRPGAIVGDVDDYISRMREESEEREKQWR